MYARIVRFTDVDSERIAALQSRVEENDGPPEGVTSSGMTVYVDADQRTAVVVGLFDSMDNIRSSEAVLEAMDSADTPGTRASVDSCEIKLEVTA